MARQEVVKFIDDLDGSEAAETVTFALDGVEYSIDLSARNAKKLREAFQVYIPNGRQKDGSRSTRVSKGRKSKSTSAPTKAQSKASAGTVDAKEIRRWAVSNKIDIPQRGRIPADLIVRFQAANA